MIPEHLVRRFISADQDAVVVSGRVPDLDSSEILPVVDKLDAALNKVRTDHPGYEIAVTGLSAIAARNSANMIEKLNRGLTVEFLLVAIFIGLAFRSVVVMFSCILPGIFPVVASGTVLWMLGEGLQFASVVALTVSFGLGLSATIHFLNRLRLERKPGVSPELAVERATVLVGPALILTTVVLACGLVVTVFSDLPSLRLFGWLSAFSMVAALVADLFILRPTSMFLINLWEKIRGTRRSREAGRVGCDAKTRQKAKSQVLIQSEPGFRVCRRCETREDQVFVIVMVTPRISPLESIWTICLVPLVRRFRLAANPAASTNTSICPPPAVPCRLPKMLRLFSLQLPEMRSPWLVTSLERSNL